MRKTSNLGYFKFFGLNLLLKLIMMLIFIERCGEHAAQAASELSASIAEAKQDQKQNAEKVEFPMSNLPMFYSTINRPLDRRGAA
jgi:CII-binding regulator of phage lambda lysogenization HflD